MEKFSKIIVPAIIGLSAVGALYVCCTHTLSRRSRAAQIDMPSTPSLPEVRRARLIFAGDLMQHTPQLTAARTPEGDFDFNASFDWVRERFRAADAAIVNLETTLSESGPYTGYPCFRSPA
ncbi:CapA family protein, partial [Alistipes putredinis]